MSLIANLLSGVIRIIDTLNHWIGKSVAWLCLLMVLLTATVVLLRKGLNLGAVPLQESVLWMHALVFLLGAGYTLQQNKHVRVDVLYSHMNARGKALVNLLGTLLLLMPFCGFIAYACWDYVELSWASNETSKNNGGLPAVYLLKSSMLIFPALLFLQGLAECLRSIMLLAGLTPPQPLHDIDSDDVLENNALKGKPPAATAAQTGAIQ